MVKLWHYPRTTRKEFPFSFPYSHFSRASLKLGPPVRHRFGPQHSFLTSSAQLASPESKTNEQDSLLPNGVEDEIHTYWKPFRNAFLDEASGEAFGEMRDMCCGNCVASSNACNPILFEPQTMSILLGQQLQINELKRKIEVLEHEINDVLWNKICAQQPKPFTP